MCKSHRWGPLLPQLGLPGDEEEAWGPLMDLLDKEGVKPQQAWSWSAHLALLKGCRQKDSFQRNIKKQQQVSSSQASGYFQRAKGMGGGSSKSLMAADTHYLLPGRVLC